MSSEVKLSIIIPCYNGGRTIGRALDSIFMQRVDFDYELIIVDDGSTDDSISIVKNYQTKHDNIRIIGDGTNHGNAIAFYNGLSASSGKYFCVLDVDDYYTINCKLQKQIDFLDRDVDEDYVAVTHYYIIDLGEGRVNLPDCSGVDEFNYMDIVGQRSGYYQTSTYVYRNIFRNRVPDLFREDRFRGDTVRTVVHLMYSNKKVKVLNMVGSAYCWSSTGIWSSMNQKDQFDRQIGIWSGLKEISSTEIERRAFDKLIDQCIAKKEKVTEEQRRYPSVSADYMLKVLRRYAGNYAFSNKEFVFKAIYYSEYLDTAASSVGFVYRQYYRNLIQTHANKDTLCMMVTSLKPRGGGIFREIIEIVQMYPDKDFYIISTESAQSDDEAFDILSKYDRLKVIVVPKDCKDKLRFLSENYVKISPEKTYYYDPHDDLFPSAIMQTGFSKNVCLFSYDHGFVCNLSSSNIDCIISKRPSDYKMLKQTFGKKVIYIPAWNDYNHCLDGFQYQPFNGHKSVITACGAARFYKLDSGSKISYIDMVLNLLKITGGQHYHFGPIPDDRLAYIREFVKENKMREDSFIYVSWAEDPLKLIVDNKVDVFIEPFPTVSYKITLDMLMGGIPIIAYDGNTRMSTMDFVYPGNLKWKTPADFIQKIESLDSDALSDHSKKSIEYFSNNHKNRAVKDFFRDEICFAPILDVNIVDGKIHDIIEYKALFPEGHVKAMSAADKGGIIGTISPPTGTDIIGNTSIRFRLKSLLIDLKLLFDKYTGKPDSKFSSNMISGLLKSQNATDHNAAYNICVKHKDKDINATAWLARMYRDGKGAEKDLNKAIKLMRNADKGNVSWAKLELTDMLLARGKDADMAEAFALGNELANAGNAGGYGRLGRMYRDGVGTQEDEDLAIEWMRKANDSGVSWTKLELTDMLLARGKDADMAEAFALGNELANAGNAGGYGRLGRMYRDGVGTQEDEDLAIEWMRKANDSGVSWAKLELTDMLLARGKDADMAEAFALGNELASKGDTKSFIPLARMYRDGVGTQRDIVVAIDWLHKAVEKRIEGAEEELISALILRRTEGDISEALALCENIAESGNSEGYNIMSRLYAGGIGVERDVNKAIYYARMASGMTEE